jgi:mannose-6-phosphate isomerase-like protein (cupin superfamily)
MDTLREGAGYTAVNLKDVDDMAPRFGHAPNMESRFARKALRLERSGISYFRLAPGFRMPFGHSHEQQEEVYVVVSGSARAKIGDEVVELHSFDAVRVAPDAVRALEGGPNGAEILAFGAPQTASSDAELTPGWWKDD